MQRLLDYTETVAFHPLNARYITYVYILASFFFLYIEGNQDRYEEKGGTRGEARERVWG